MSYPGSHLSHCTKELNFKLVDIIEKKIFTKGLPEGESVCVFIAHTCILQEIHDVQPTPALSALIHIILGYTNGSKSYHVLKQVNTHNGTDR